MSTPHRSHLKNIIQVEVECCKKYLNIHVPVVAAEHHDIVRDGLVVLLGPGLRGRDLLEPPLLAGTEAAHGSLPATAAVRAVLRHLVTDM